MKICPKCALRYGDDDERCFVDNTVLEVAPDPNLGKTLAGRYLIEEKLGEGGMATVYRARHVLVDRPVAVKILLPTVAENPSIKERFRREAKNAAALTHPNIIEIYEHGETDDGAPFLVMELLIGHVLSSSTAHGPMPPGEVAAIGLQIAQGLARAHDFGVIHRDLKPDNVFLAELGGRRVVKLLDFGIARSTKDSRLTNAGELFGTPQYMAPERLTSIDAGAPSDLYALGVMLYEMLTGRLPFEAETLPALFLAHLQEVPPRPSTRVPGVPRRLDDLVMALLEKKPEARPVDAHVVIRELAAVAPAELVAAPPPPSTAQKPVAATLPPTTLERWAGRAALFEAMVRRAYPSGAPAALSARVEQIRSAISRVQALRGESLALQRQLDAIESESRETRGRLGYAMQRVGEGLSRAREALRKAEGEMAPYLASEADLSSRYHAAAATLLGHGRLDAVEAPSEELGAALRITSEALDRWTMAFTTASRAREFLEARSAEVSDLEFQVKALREQVGRIEAESTTARASLEADIATRTHDVEVLQTQLLGHGQAIVEALRPRDDLQDLFARLESDREG